jgi:hypothetical protein
MSAQHHSAPGDESDRDLYARERVLNSAIVATDISSGWEEYLEIFDALYADDVEVTTDTKTGAVRGRERIRTLLFNDLAPLHVMAEIGGLSIQIRESPTHGDAADEPHSAWSGDLIGVSSRTCNLAWCTLRRWPTPAWCTPLRPSANRRAANRGRSKSESGTGLVLAVTGRLSHANLTPLPNRWAGRIGKNPASPRD